MLNRSVEQSQRENFAINMRVHSYEKYLEMKGYDYDEELLAEKNSTFGKVNRCIDVVISCVKFDLPPPPPPPPRTKYSGLVWIDTTE